MKLVSDIVQDVAPRVRGRGHGHSGRGPWRASWCVWARTKRQGDTYESVLDKTDSTRQLQAFLLELRFVRHDQLALAAESCLVRLLQSPRGFALGVLHWATVPIASRTNGNLSHAHAASAFAEAVFDSHMIFVMLNSVSTP